MNLYLDIETIPSQRDDVRAMIAETITHPATIKKQETIDKWVAEKRDGAVDDAWRKTSLNGTYGEIICIGFAFDDEAPQVVYRKLGESEADMLAEFFKIVYDKIHAVAGKPEPLTWIGHYITGFDLRFIWQRAVINKVKPPFKIPYDSRPWDESLYDTKVSWTGIKSTGYGKASDLALAYDIDGKTDGMDGSKVWDAILAGRYGDVCEYCQDDVELARNMHRLQTFYAPMIESYGG